MTNELGTLRNIEPKAMYVPEVIVKKIRKLEYKFVIKILPNLTRLPENCQSFVRSNKNASRINKTTPELKKGTSN